MHELCMDRAYVGQVCAVGARRMSLSSWSPTPHTQLFSDLIRVSGLVSNLII